MESMRRGRRYVMMRLVIARLRLILPSERARLLKDLPHVDHRWKTQPHL